MRIVAFVAAVFVLSANFSFSADDPSTQPAVDARAVLEDVVSQWNSAERISARYRFSELQLPEPDDADELVHGRNGAVQCTLFLRRPDGIDVRGGTFSPESRFMFDRELVYRGGVGPNGVVFSASTPEQPDLDEILGHRHLAHTWVHDQFIWMLRADGWRDYFHFAKNVRLVGWIMNSTLRPKEPLARIAFDTFDEASWELWIDLKNQNALKRVTIQDKTSTNFVRTRDAQPGGNLSNIIDEEMIKRAKRVDLRRTRVLEFDHVSFDEEFPAEAFARPEGDIRKFNLHDESAEAQPGGRAPPILGRDQNGKVISTDQFKDQAFVAIILNFGEDGFPARLRGPLLHIPVVVRETVKDPSAVVVFLGPNSPDSVKDLLRQPEYQGATVIVSESEDAFEAFFTRGSVAIIGRDGSVVWNGMVYQPLMFPEFARSLEAANSR